MILRESTEKGDNQRLSLDNQSKLKKLNIV